MTFAQVAARAIAYARDGFPLRAADGLHHRTAARVHQPVADQSEDLAQAGRQSLSGRRHDRAAGSRRRRCRRWWTPNAPPPAAGAPPASRPRAIGSTRATSRRRWCASCKENGAPFDASDFAEFFARVEAPASVTYRGLTVYKHGFGSQGPALLQTLNILENFDLKKMGHNSADYLHVVTEAMKMALRGSRQLLRRSGLREGAGEGTAVEGVRESCAPAKSTWRTRSRSRSPATRCRSIRT